MKKLTFIIFFLLLSSCNRNYPKRFSSLALKENLITFNSTQILFKDILKQQVGKTVVLVFWASWCKDCIRDFPNLKEIQNKYPEVSYVFLSVDKSIISWKKAIKKYNLDGFHYNLPKGMNKGNLVDFVNLNWISRFMVLDKQGIITLFKATKASDTNIIEALN